MTRPRTFEAGSLTLSSGDRAVLDALLSGRTPAGMDASALDAARARIASEIRRVGSPTPQWLEAFRAVATPGMLEGGHDAFAVCAVVMERTKVMNAAKCDLPVGNRHPGGHGVGKAQAVATAPARREETSGAFPDYRSR